jgi:hypothetical protein
MPRAKRGFQAECAPLEGRIVLSAAPTSAVAVGSPAGSDPVQFESTLGNLVNETFGAPALQVVPQNAGQAIVTLSRPTTAGVLQVNVHTSSLDPGVGVNVGAVDRTVTFPDGAAHASLIVPIISGAPNPGAVDVTLWGSEVGLKLDLEVVASDPSAPPKIVAENFTDRGLVLTFNKPMDPISASNVNNYSVGQALKVNHGRFLSGLVGGFVSALAVAPAPLKAAVYDPSSQSVTLTFKKGLAVNADTVVSQGTFPKKSIARGRHSSGPGLTDLQGNPINAASTPGKVALALKTGNQDYLAQWTRIP